MSQKNRYCWLDNVRGLWLISMAAYHLCYDLNYMFGFDWEWYDSIYGYIWQQSIVIGFVLIAGFSALLSRQPLKRGLEIFACGLLITVVTLIFMPDFIIIFGVLSLIGCCYIIVGASKKLLKKIHPFFGMVVCLLCFIFTKNLPKGYLGLGSWELYQFPDELYSVHGMVFGFRPENFVSSDYVPLFPWLFLFLCGFFLGRLVLEGKSLPNGKNLPLLAFLGRHSLVFYMLHQPIIYGLLWLLQPIYL